VLMPWGTGHSQDASAGTHQYPSFD
jgi:hypothetical protein